MSIDRTSQLSLLARGIQQAKSWQWGPISYSTIIFQNGAYYWCVGLTVATRYFQLGVSRQNATRRKQKL